MVKCVFARERERYGNGVHVCTQRELEQCEREIG